MDIKTQNVKTHNRTTQKRCLYYGFEIIKPKRQYCEVQD